MQTVVVAVKLSTNSAPVGKLAKGKRKVIVRT